MADSQSLGEIVVSIIADTTKLDSGLNTANQSVSKFDKSGQKAAKNTEKLQKNLDKTGTEAKDAGKEIKNLGDELEDEAKNADKSSDALQDTAKNIEKVGDKSQESEGWVKKLDSVLKVFGTGFSVLAIVTALQKIVDKLLDIQREAVNTQNKLNTLYSDPMTAGEMQSIIQRDNRDIKGDYTKEQKMVVTMAVEKNFKSLLDDQKLILKQEIIDVASALGMDTTELADATKKIVDKWGFTESQATDVVEYIKVIATKYQFGADISKNFSEDIYAYAERDDVAQAYGFSFEEWTKALVALDSEKDKAYKDVGNSINLLDSVWQKTQAAIKDAQTQVKSLPDEIAAKQAALSTTEDESDRKKLIEEIADAQQKLAEYQEIVGKTQTQLLQEILKGKDYTTIDIKDLEGFSQVRQIIVNSADVQLPEMTTGFVPTTRDSDIGTAGKRMDDLAYSIGELVSPNSKLTALQESNDKLQEAILQAIQTKFGITSTENMLAVAELRNPYGTTIQEREENRQKLLIELDLEYFNGEFTGLSEDLKPLDDILEELISDVESLDNADVSGFTREIEEAQKQLEDLGKTDDIDTSEMVEALEEVKKAVIDGDEGVIPALKNFDGTLTNSKEIIDNINIPANERLWTSLKKIEDKYWDIVRAKAAAAM